MTERVCCVRLCILGLEYTRANDELSQMFTVAVYWLIQNNFMSQLDPQHQFAPNLPKVHMNVTEISQFLHTNVRACLCVYHIAWLTAKLSRMTALNVSLPRWSQALTDIWSRGRKKRPSGFVAMNCVQIVLHTFWEDTLLCAAQGIGDYMFALILESCSTSDKCKVDTYGA